jgi:hypothetical protein
MSTTRLFRGHRLAAKLAGVTLLFALAAFPISTAALAGEPAGGSCHVNFVADGETPFTFSGVLTQREVWDQPASGSRPKTGGPVAWILKLDSAAPIAIDPGTKAQQDMTLAELQLRGKFEHRRSAYKAYLGKHVVVDGTLSVPRAWNDATLAVVDAERIAVTQGVACASDAQAGCLVQGKRVTFVGVLRKEWYSGPDGNSRSAFLGLHVDRPLCFLPDPAYGPQVAGNGAASGVRIMELVGNYDDHRYQRLVGKRIHLSARPLQSDNGNQATLVLLDDVKIEGE